MLLFKKLTTHRKRSLHYIKKEWPYRFTITARLAKSNKILNNWFRKLPNEVVQVFADDVSAKTRGGITTYNASIRRQEAIAKYPEHFPWDTIYNSIPKEVHDAYNVEAYPELHAYNAFIYNESLEIAKETIAQMPPNKGLSEYIEQQGQNISYKTEPFTEEMFLDWIDRIHKSQMEEWQRKHDETTRFKTIWDKHYKTYNLSFQE